MDAAGMRALLGRAVESLADAFVLVEGHASDGVSRRIIFVNGAFTAMTGFTADEAIGKTPDITIGPETDRETLLAIKRAREANEPARVELLKYRKDGTTFWAEMDLIPVYDDEGKLTNYCSFMRDVTDRRAAQLRRMETARLAALGTLAAGFAHEMNNPLAYALMNIGFVEEELPALIETPNDPKRWAELASTVAEIRHGVSRVAQIVRDIRAFSRPEVVPSGRCRVPVIVERAVQMARAGMPACARIATHYDVTAEVRADPSHLSQVFLNLVLNALDAIPPHESANKGVEVRAFNDAGNVVVEVRDEGTGIPPEVMPRIFDPFFTTKDTGKGLGLGLSISYGLVRSIGGKMTVESKVGIGTSVRVALPAASTISDSTGVGDPSDNLTSAGLRLRILVVDDEPMIGRALRRALVRRDDVVVCLSGDDALDLLEASREYHLILCDLSMPGMTGASFYQRVGERWPELVSRVVIMTGGTSTASARRFLQESAVPRLDKPLDLVAIRNMLERIRTTYPQLPA